LAVEASYSTLKDVVASSMGYMLQVAFTYALDIKIAVDKKG